MFIDISPQQLRPIVELACLHSPVLIAAGEADAHTTVSETIRLYKAANDPKELWIVPGAAHVDLHAFSPKAYELKISAFLERWLRPAAQT